MPHPLRSGALISAYTSFIGFGLISQGIQAQTVSPAAPEIYMQHDPIDLQYAQCTAADSSTAGELQCLQAAHLAWDKALNSSYQALLKQLPKAEKIALQQAQRQWLAFRNAEWESLDQRYAAKDGSIYQVLHAAKRMELTKQRAIQLRDYQTLLKD